MIFGKRQGQGKMTYTKGTWKGCAYEGEWDDDNREGQGWYVNHVNHARAMFRV